MGPLAAGSGLPQFKVQTVPFSKTNIQKMRGGRMDSGLFQCWHSVADRGTLASKFHLGELRGTRAFIARKRNYR